MTLYLYIRELWRREQDCHPTKSITFDMMAGACAYLADETAHHILVSSISGRDQSFDKRFATNSLTKGLVRTSYSRRNEWGKKVSRLILRPFIFFQFAFSTVYQIFRIVSFIQLKYTIGRSDVNLRSYLTQDWPDAEFWKAFPDYYYALPFGPEFWIRKIHASKILSDLVNARILRLTEGNYDFSHKLLLYAFRAQRDFIEGVTYDPSKLGRRSTWTRADYRDDVRTLLLAGLAHDKDDFIAKLSEHDPYIAVKCIKNGIEVNSFTREKIINNLLTQLRQVDHDWLAVHIVTALNSLTDPTIIGDLLDTVESNPFEPLRDAVIDTIINLQYDAVPSLLNHLPDCGVKAASVIIRALSRICDKRAIQPLEQWGNNNPDHYYYLWAMAALSHLGDNPSKKHYFEHHLCYPPPSTKKSFDISSYCQAWTAFCQTAPDHSLAFQELFNVVLSTIDDPHGDVSFIQNSFYRTVKFTHLLNESINGDLMVAYQNTINIEIRLILIELFAERQVTEAGDILVEDIYDPNLRLASTIIEAMGNLRIDIPNVTRAIIGYLDHPETHIRHAAIIALGKIGNPEAALPISKLLTDTERIEPTRTNAQLAAESLLTLDTPIAKEKAADY